VDEGKRGEVMDGMGKVAAYLHGQHIEVLRDQLAAEKKRADKLQAQYSDLIMSVGMKHPGESRHDTAKRYILNAENGSGEAVEAIKSAQGKGIKGPLVYQGQWGVFQ
jgi:hypothetical protein